jgi:hypothetical protein
MDTNRTPVVRPVYSTIAEPLRTMDDPGFLNMHCLLRVSKHGQHLNFTAGALCLALAVSLPVGNV